MDYTTYIVHLFNVVHCLVPPILPLRSVPHTCGVAGLCAEGQDLDILVVGAGGQQLAALAPGHAVDGALVVLVPPEANHGLLDRPARVAAGGRADGRAGGRADGRTHTHTHTQLVYVCSVDFYREG